MKARKLVGVFSSNISSRIQGNLFIELHKKASECGYNLMFFSGNYNKSDLVNTAKVTERLYNMAEYMEFAAFIIHVQALGDLDLIQQIIDMGKKRNIPIFLYDCDPLGLTKSEGVYAINPNYKQGFAEGVRHLIEHHHCKNIFMLGGVRNNRFSDDRIDMYRQEMDAHGIPYVEEQIGYGDFWEMPAAAAVNKFLDSDLPTPEAICCANDSMALATVKTLKKRGLRVPEDILVTGFDGIEDGRYSFPNISTCEPQFDTVAEYIFDILEGKDQADEFWIPLRFYPKESCGCNQGFNTEDKTEMTDLVDNMHFNSWQHHFLVSMQFALIDSIDLSEMRRFMDECLDLFGDCSHAFCVREDIENHEDYTEELGKIRVQMNKNLLPDDAYPSFDVEEIIPNFTQVIETASPKTMFFMRLLHNGDKLYGYHFFKSEEYSTNILRLLGQFDESITMVTESILRNKHLSVANQKLNEMYDKMSEIYIRDTMTGLYNRHGYYQYLDEYMKRPDLQEGYVHIISIDMDGMKQINDNYGHLEGDLAIMAVAQAIQDCFSQPYVGARFGGDEFEVALFTEIGDKLTTEEMSIKMNHYLKTMPMLAGKEYSVVVSLGQAIAKLSEVDDFKAIEKMADDMMYKEKRGHKLK